MKYLSDPKVRKFAIVAAWALVGAAVQAGLIPQATVDAVKSLVSGHEGFLLGLIGLGHVLPEAGAKKP
jgi:hypothetical protein